MARERVGEKGRALVVEKEEARASAWALKWVQVSAAK